MYKINQYTNKFYKLKQCICSFFVNFLLYFNNTFSVFVHSFFSKMVVFAQIGFKVLQCAHLSNFFNWSSSNLLIIGICRT